MIYNYLPDLANSDNLLISFSVKSNVVIQTYSISYITNLEPAVDTYTVSYDSYNTLEIVDVYTVNYTSIFGDLLQTYRLRYTSNREPKDIAERYYVRYTSSFTLDSYSFYSIRYTSTSATTESARVRYKIKYTSESAADSKQTYRIRYTASTFYDNFSKYTIKYATTGAEELLIRAVLLRDSKKTDALFEIKGVIDKPLDSYLFVVSNMPKYQTVEYVIGEELPYLRFIESATLVEQDIFDMDGSTSYDVRGYLLLKDVEDLNGISIDVYDREDDYRKINKSKTYFFGLEQTDYIETLLSINSNTYYFINRSSDYYNDKYLNYVSTNITPTFRFGIDCCFSRKINKTNYSYCSPF
jgi:hypothetical protein